MTTYMSTDPGGRLVLHYSEVISVATEVYNFLFDRDPDPRRDDVMAELNAVIEWAEGESSG